MMLSLHVIVYDSEYFRKGLMTYKHFIQALEDDVSPDEAGSR
jgi:hypothetical protein